MLFMLLQEELSAGLWLSGECLLLHSVLVCLDENEKLLRSVGLEGKLDKLSSFSFEVCTMCIVMAAGHGWELNYFKS